MFDKAKNWMRIVLAGSKPSAEPTSRIEKPKPTEFNVAEATRLHHEGLGYRKIARRFRNISYITVRTRIREYEAHFECKPVERVRAAFTERIPEPVQVAEPVVPQPITVPLSLRIALAALGAPAKISAPPPAPVVDEHVTAPKPVAPVKTVSVTRAEYDAAVAAGVAFEMAKRDAAAKRIAAAEPAVAPIPEHEQPIDWAEEARTDLPTRSTERIRFLLQFESEAQTVARIQNDKERYRRQQAGHPGTNPQTAIVHGKPTGNVSTWVRR